MDDRDLATYYQYREYMDTGDLLLWRGPSALSAGIRWKTGSDVNHASSVITFSEYSDCCGDDKDQFRVFQAGAIAKGYFITPLSELLRRYPGEVFWLPLKSDYREYRRAFGAEMLALSGHEYDFIGLLKNFFHRVQLGMERVYCSESWQGMGYKIGLPKLEGYEDIGMWPGELEKLGWTENRVKILF